MRDSQLFLAELKVGHCHIAHQPENRTLGLTFRIGKTVVHSPYSKTIEGNIANFNITLPLNTDRSALETQRCSLALTYQNGTPQGGIAGLALLTIPKQQCLPMKRYKLVQCEDKSAYIELQLKISSLDETSSASRRSSSSFRSIMEMQQFDRNIISPPQLFTVNSEISQRSVNFLLPPKPRYSRQREQNPLAMSIHSQAIEQDRAQLLQNECNCLKKLLRVQIQKNKECITIIDKLVQAVQNCESCLCMSPTQLDQTILIEENGQKSQQRMSFQTISEYLKQIEELTIQNKRLTKQKKQLEELVIKLSDLAEEKASKIEDKKGGSNKDLVRRLQVAERNNCESNKRFQRLNSELLHLQKQLLSKQEELELFKRKMKVESKFSSLKHIDVQKFNSPTATIRSLTERLIAEKKQMIKLLLQLYKQQNDSAIREGCLLKIRQKVEKIFNSISSKRLTKQTISIQKNQLLKHIEQCLSQPTKLTQY